MSTKTTSLPFLIVVVAATAAACGGNHPTSAPERDAGAGADSATPPPDAATADGAGADGATPLPINGLLAEERVASVLWAAAEDAERLPWQPPTTREELAADVRKMLADPRAAVGVDAFFRWWLGLDGVTMAVRDPQLFPTYTPELAMDMAHETATFGVNVTLNLNGSFQTLLTAPFSFVNTRLADVYGVVGVTGDGLQQVDLDPTERAGLLTQPALQVLGSLANRNSPSLRGSSVARTFFCQPFRSSPANTPLPELQPGVTLRQTLVDDGTSGAGCAPCHSLYDPPGLAFETFDPIGRWRTTDNGAPVYVSGLILSATLSDQGTARPFSGPFELSSIVASSSEAERCMAEQWLAFALKSYPQDLPIGAGFGVVAGETSVQVADADVTPLYEAFRAASFNLQELIVAVLTSDAFLVPPPPLRTQ